MTDQTKAVHVDDAIPLELRMLMTITSLAHGAEMMKDYLDKNEMNASSVVIVRRELESMHDQCARVIATFLKEIGKTPDEFLEFYEQTREDAIEQQKQKSNI